MIKKEELLWKTTIKKTLCELVGESQYVVKFEWGISHLVVSTCMYLNLAKAIWADWVRPVIQVSWHHFSTMQQGVMMSISVGEKKTYTVSHKQ